LTHLPIKLQFSELKDFLVIYSCHRKHCLYLIGLDILFNTECLIQWICSKYCLHNCYTYCYWIFCGNWLWKSCFVLNP